MTENTIAIVERAFDPEVTPSPFGERWGGELFMLSPAHLAALQAGETLALDVMSEYITFIALEKPNQTRETLHNSQPRIAAPDAAVGEPWEVLDWPAQVNRG